MKRRYKKVKRIRCKKTEKVIFTESEARRFVKNSISSDESQRKETRYYFCSSCEGYHMTKMSKEKYVETSTEEQLQKESKRRTIQLYFKNKWEILIKKKEVNEQK